MDLKPCLSPPPRVSAGPAPVRAPGSVRRTSSLDFSWPEGQAGASRLVARARDVVTPRSGGAPVVCAEDAFEAVLRPDRTILAIASDPPRPALARLVGERGGGGLRKVLEAVAPEERRRTTPLYLILDDISGASLVSVWAWTQWDPDWLAAARAGMPDLAPGDALPLPVGVCIGFAPGASAFDPHANATEAGAPAADLRNPADPDGWHAFTDQAGVVALRRARRIDISRGELIVVDAAFQDSATTPAGGRAAVHEYSLRLTADPGSLKVLSIAAEPHVLPRPECPSATANLARLVGAPLPELRERVFAELKGVAGCTHLNDALRALADVPALLRHLEAPPPPP